MSDTHSTGIVLRPARAADRDQLGQLGAQMVAVHHAFDARRFIAPTAGTAAAYGGFLAQQLARSDAIVRVAAEGPIVLGYVYAAIEGNDYMALRGPAGVIYDLIVASDRRRQGIGRTLLDLAATELRDRGAPRLVLFTAERNEKAQRLFAAGGFRRTMVEMTRELP